MEQVVEWLKENWAVIPVALSFVIQVTPVKWCPWTSFFRWIGKTLIGDLREQVADMQKAIDTNEKDRIRWEVLDFANSCRNNREHTKDEFQHMIALNCKYEELLAKTKDKNGVFEAEYKYILQLYERGEFL